MATSRLVAGTPITWKNTGGNKLLTLTSLANGSAWQGEKSASLVHGTYGLPELLAIFFETALAVAGTNGNTVDLFFGESDSATAGTNNPGNLSGSDAAWSNPAELFGQLRYAGSLIVSNARGTNPQKVRLILPMPTVGYICPAVFNQSGQALHGTASNHALTVTPFYRTIS